MKKKIISMIFLLTIFFSTYMVALAEDGNTQFISTASQLKSKGVIVYQNETDSVVIDSNDLYILADAFDSFKTAVYSQMAEMNTYLTMEDKGIDLTTSNDIHVIHSTPSDIVDPLSVNFDTLIEGLAASQSIPHTPSEYGYAEGTSLYKTVEGLLTTEASDETEMIEIEGAIADNLSAGTSAWVDGKLILGTGVDNKSFYEQGNTDGYEQGNTDGYEQGNIDGYKQGYTDGYKQGNYDIRVRINITTYNKENYIGMQDTLHGYFYIYKRGDNFTVSAIEGLNYTSLVSVAQGAVRSIKTSIEIISVNAV